METLQQIIDTTLSSFDFGYCLIVNVLTYLVIKFIDELNKEKEVSIWTKRGVLLASILLIGGIYYLIGNDVKLLINSAILAPISWSIIFKPICKMLKIDYKKIDKINKMDK